ncbi:MAG: ABC transporter permease [Halobacteriales archaeon]|jgi:ABC-2 type transport system permease protein|nr:ABC transporter permease [Halobacteriales archaeon]
MNLTRILAESSASWKSFLRKRTAVFFTFLFPIILVSIFSFLVGTQTSGLFSEDPAYYVASYISIVILFTPISRMSMTVARGRDGSLFEKLSTTPLTQTEWLLAHTITIFKICLFSTLLVLIIASILTDFTFTIPLTLILFIFLGSFLFCNIGVILGSITKSQDGAITASNSLALPLLFLSDTFIPLNYFPTWFVPLISFSPLTPFSRATRDIFISSTFPIDGFILLVLLNILVFAISSYLLPFHSD